MRFGYDKGDVGKNMIISIASGKGGTGKTTIATNLARIIGTDVLFLDCDVEEPNAHIFLKPDIDYTEKVGIPVPKVDLEKCTHCGKCGEICRFSAILPMKDNVLVFPELCHGCGGCTLACPEGAISETAREVGVLEKGVSGEIEFVHGRLRIGEPMSPPLISAVKKYINPEKVVIIDAPPGTSCAVIESVRDSDLCLLVTEPTPFGLNDLKLAVEMVKLLDVPIAIVINRCDAGDREVYKYCDSENLQIVLEIPLDRKVAVAYSEGKLITDAIVEYRSLFEGLRDWIFNLKSGTAAFFPKK